MICTMILPILFEIALFVFLLLISLGTYFAAENIFFAINHSTISCKFAGVSRNFFLAKLTLDEFWFHFFTFLLTFVSCNNLLLQRAVHLQRGWNSAF